MRKKLLYRIPHRIAGAAILCTMFLLSNCTTTPPDNIDNICSIFREKDDWYDDAKDSEKKWGTPIHVQMAIIRQESSFKHDARPPRKKLLGFVPWKRPSSAVGYAQALDGTWEIYKKQAGGWGASREDFEDAIDFVGWYTNRSNKLSKISKWNAKHQYLAYHEGQGGYNRKTYTRKKWLIRTANNVGTRASRYSSQLKSCEKEFTGTSWLGMF